MASKHVGSIVALSLLVAGLGTWLLAGVERAETAAESVSSDPNQDFADVFAALEGPVTDAGYETTVDVSTGQLRVTVQPGMTPIAAPVLAEFGDRVVLVEFEEEVGRG